MNSLQLSVVDEAHSVASANAVMKQSRMPPNDDIVEKVKSKMKLKRRISLEVVNSHFAAIGIMKQKPVLDFYPRGEGWRLVLSIGREMLSHLSVSADKLQEVLESIILRFRKLRSVSVNTYNDDQTKAMLDSLVQVAIIFNNMEIRRFSAVRTVDDAILASFVPWIKQFADGLRQLKLHLSPEQFSLNETIQAVGLCQNLRHLDLLFFTDMDIPSYLDKLHAVIQDTSFNQQFATTFANILSTFTHLRTLRLTGHTSLFHSIDFQRAATHRTLTISESWLSFVCEPAFKAILDKMKNCKMHMRDLPLSNAKLTLLCHLLEGLPQSAEISFHELASGVSLLMPMNTVLTNWLLLAKQMRKYIQLNTRCALPTAEQLTEALETLPNAGIVESKVIEEECHFYFQYGNGGRLTVKCKEVIDVPFF